MKFKKNKTDLFIILGFVSIVVVIIGALMIFSGSASVFPENNKELENLVYCIDKNIECEYDPSGSLMVCDSVDIIGMQMPFLLEGNLFVSCLSLFDIVDEEMGDVSKVAFFGDEVLYSVGETIFTCNPESNFVVLIDSTDAVNSFINLIKDGKPWDCDIKIPSFSVGGDFR